MHYEIFVKGFKINKLNFQINEKPWKGWGGVVEGGVIKYDY